MNLIFLFPLFFLATIFSFYVPGALSLLFFFPKLSEGKRFIASWATGISFFLLVSYLLAWIHADFVLLILLIGTSILALIKKKSIFYIPQIRDYIVLGIIILGSLSFAAVTFFSGYRISGGLQFVGTINAIDGLLHIANMQNFLLHFPPTHASLNGIPLRGYHYFYDLLASRFILFYKFSPFDLHYRFFPLFISALFGGAVYLFTSELTNNKYAKWFVLFFAYFAQSSGPFVHLVVNQVSPQSELGIVYPLELITNPAILLSISLLLVFFYLLLKLQTWKQAIILGILLGVISEVKIYTGIIALSSSVLYFLYSLVKTKKFIFSLIFMLFVAAVITAVTYLPNNGGSGYLWFSPFFVYSVFMQEPPVDVWNWELQRRIFVLHHNIPHLAVLYIQAFIVFWVLSLGTRFLFLLGIFSIFKKSFWQGKNLLIASAIIIPIVIGSLFVQSISIFDTKQFLWIAAVLLAIPAGIVVGNIFSKVSLPIKILLLIILGFGLFQEYVFQMNISLFHTDTFVVNTKQADLLNKVKSIVPKNNFIVVLPNSSELAGIEKTSFERAPVIAAMTNSNTYFEPESAQYDLKNIFEKRTTLVSQMSKAISMCDLKKVNEVLQTIGTKYVLAYPQAPCASSNFVQQRITDGSMTFYIFK